MRYAFNHDTQKINEAMGIDEQRSDELLSASKKAVFAAFVSDDKINDTVKMIELCINEGQPKNIVEALFMGFHLGRGEVKISELARKMQAMLKNK